MKETELKDKILESIKAQGFKINPHVRPAENDKEVYRQIQQQSKLEQVNFHKSFLKKNINKIKQHLVSGSALNPSKIDLELQEVTARSKEEIFFRWWNLVWWSVPYQRAYGRQMRYLLWDKGHDAPFGLIGLQSPILKMSVRDKALEIPNDELDIWVNQSMQAQRLGALPPYNELLGGKMAALAMTSNEIRDNYEQKYNKQISIIKKRIIEPRLLFITTTSAFGRSSIYNRLKYYDQRIAYSLGYTKGAGSFHIPEELFQELMNFLKKKGVNVKRSFGHGPSRRIKLLCQAFKLLGLPDYSYHHVKREFYLFPLVKNLKAVITQKELPDFYDRPFEALCTFWRTKRCLPRAESTQKWKIFNPETYLEKTLSAYGVM